MKKAFEDIMIKGILISILKLQLLSQCFLELLVYVFKTKLQYQHIKKIS